jgi:DNA-binding response OmpR family regulator
LVIDDSATVRKIMEMCHRRSGFAIQTFADGVEALRWLSANQAIIPSLIYLDIEMPRMDGFEVARALHTKSAFASVPILMFSSRDKTLDRLKGRLVGARGYVTKPFREQEILAITRSYLLPAESVAVAE